jgi:hypothetical protein
MKSREWQGLLDDILFKSLEKWFVFVGMNSGMLVRTGCQFRCSEKVLRFGKRSRDLTVDAAWYVFNYETLGLKPVFLVVLERTGSEKLVRWHRECLKDLCRLYGCSCAQVRVGGLGLLDEGRMDEYVSEDYWRFASVVMGKKRLDDDSLGMYSALRHLFSYGLIDHKMLFSVENEQFAFHDVPSARFAWWLDFYSGGNLLKLLMSGLTLGGKWRLKDILSVMSMNADGTFVQGAENWFTGNAVFAKKRFDELVMEFLDRGSMHDKKRRRKLHVPRSG